MDNMRNRYRVPRRDYGLSESQAPAGRPARPLQRPEPPRPSTIHDSLRHAYQPPPEPAPASQQVQPRHNHQPPLQPRPVPAHRPVKRKRKKLRKTLFVLVLLAALGTAGVWAYPRYARPNPFPADIQTNAGINLFYPTKLPAGYTIDKSKIDLANGVVLYSATNGDQRLVFTLQKIPPTFDFTTFYKQQLTGSQQFNTPYGQATIGKNSNRNLGSLTSGNSWLLLSTNSSAVSLDDFSLVMTHLKKY